MMWLRYNPDIHRDHSATVIELVIKCPDRLRWDVSK